MKELLRKYQPILLIALTIFFGGVLLLQKGFIELPTLDKKANTVILKRSVVDLLFSGKEYKLSYAGTDPVNITSIVKFDKTEQWQGAGSVEKDESEPGGAILSLIDRDRRGSSAYTYKNLNLSNIDTIKFTVALKSFPLDIESLNLIFSSKDGKNFYRFPITNLTSGINYFSIPKYSFFLSEETFDTKQTSTVSSGKTSFGWDKIEKIQVELFSRPNAKANMEISWIRGEKDDLFTPEWNWDGNEHFLNLVVGADGKPTMLVQYIGRSIATLKKIGSVKDFSYTARVTSLRKGNAGLFFRGDYKTGYGYYFVTGGLGTSDWSIIKISLVGSQSKIEELLTGQIGNFEFSKDQPYWLRVIAKGTSLKLYLSLDNKDFIKLGEVNDTSFSTGGVGISSSNGGIAYFDEFSLIQQ